MHEMFNWCSELHFHIGPYLNNEIQPPQHDLHVAIADIAQHLSFKMLAHMKEEHGELHFKSSAPQHAAPLSTLLCISNRGWSYFPLVCAPALRNKGDYNRLNCQRRGWAS